MEDNFVFDLQEAASGNASGLLSVLQSILDSEFSSSEKRRILVYDTKLKFACPVCGDSKRNEREKRAMIWVNEDEDGSTFLIFRCYNGGCEAAKWSIKRFLEHFGKESGSFATVQGPTEKRRSFVGSPDLGSMAIPKSEVLKAFGLVDAINDVECMRYLKKRMVTEVRGGFPNFAYSRFNKSLYMLNTTSDDKSVIGMQARWAKPKFSRFRTWTLTDLHNKVNEKLGKEDSLAGVERELLEKADRTPMLYNVMHVDLYAERLYTLESTINCHNVMATGEHAVATWGSSGKFVAPNGWYMFDCDAEDADREGNNKAAGIVASMASLKAGRMTFLWGKFHDEVLEYSGCNDLNDMFVRKPLKTMKYLDPYFSDSALDIMYVQ
jgi:hypothetical protein